MSGWNDGSRAKCTKCGKVMRGSEPGECFRCRTGRARPDTTKVKGERAPKKRRDSDDAVLDRVLGTAASSAKAGMAEAAALVTGAIKAKQHAAVETEETWLAKFFRLHEALGLNPDEAIEKHCRSWVEMTTARALGESLVEIGERKLRKRAAAPPNGALENIGDDYERAREQAAAGEPA